MKMRNSLAVAVAAAITAVCLSIAVKPAKAAAINWGSAQNITGTASNDIVTTGTLFASANFFQTTGSGSGNVTVNGVQFNGFLSPAVTNPGPTTLTVGNITLTGTVAGPQVNLQGFSGLGGPASYGGLLNQLAYIGNTTNQGTMVVSIGGLTIGAQYLIQHWANDSRSGVAASRTNFVDGNLVDVNVGNTLGAFGQYITGTFTADGTTQTYNVTGGVGNVAYANAMQVRLLAVPEPSTWAMAAVGVACAVTGGELQRRRRRVR